MNELIEENMRTAALIKDVGVESLGDFSECTCCDFKVRNVEVDISCGKGRERGLWISSPSLYYYGEDPSLLKPIAEEVARQVEHSDGRGPLPIHFHAWEREDEE